MMKKNLAPVMFWALVGIFLVIASEFFIPVFRELVKGSPLFLLPPAIFFLLGLALVFLTLKEKVGGILKKFLLLTGAFAVGFFISVFLHNAFYALAEVTNDIIVLKYLMETFSVLFFFVAIIACPLGFLVGAVGSAVLFIRKKKQENNFNK